MEVRARRASVAAARPEVGCFFSGGVDSLYTALRHIEEVTDLVLIGGFEISVSNRVRMDEATRRSQAFADAFGKRLVTVVTNLKELCAFHGLDMRTLYHGAFLASVALGLGFGRTYVAASHTYSELLPWGSHPLLDPLWSTEGCTIVHDGAGARRSGKLEAVCASPEALQVLRVCGRDGAEYNCGRCEKCLRTMATLRLLGKEAATLPRLRSAAPLRKLRIADESEKTFFVDNRTLAAARGDREIARALRAPLRRYEAFRLLRKADEVFLAGAARRVYRRIRPLDDGTIEAEVPS